MKCNSMTDFIFNHLLELIYLVASVSFILGLKMLNHPDSARRGNLLAAAGMILAILGTIFLYRDASGDPLGNYLWIFAGIAIGTVIGTLMAQRVKMTAMPQMVSFFNGMGGACAALIAIVEFAHFHNPEGSSLLNGEVLTMHLGLIIGSVSFSGSMIAYGKLEGKIGDKVLPAQQFFNIGLAAILVGLAVYTMMQYQPDLLLFSILFAGALLYGVLFVMPIGGADMPVVISLLNSFTGIAAAFGGFLYANQVMLTGGILVGSAGTILTILMCKAMNRSLTNVLIGAFGGGQASAKAGDDEKTVQETTTSDTAVLLAYSRQVMIVPGYGLAVAQAQHICHDLDQLLEERGVNVYYAIHSVAGRMPGHMNVLLAEADIPYTKLLEMEEANEQMPKTDAVIVIGANDVVNPAAETDPSSPIYGMPILNVLEASNVIVVKRSMSYGYAGIDNHLFYHDKTKMLFSDAKTALEDMVKEIKAHY